MKKFFGIIATLSLLLGVGCQDKGNDTENGQSTFKLEQTEVEATAEGMDVEINYDIKNPQSGAVVLTDCKANWIKDLSTATYGTIKFTVAPNFKKEARETTITVQYTAVEEKYQIVVKQSASDVEAFTYEILSNESTALSIEVTPADTEYVVYCYHINLSNGHATDWEVYTETIRTAATETIDENITMSFEVHGAHITQTVTTENPETYYYTECWSVNDFKSYFGDDVTPEEIFPRRWNEQVTMKRDMGYQPSSIIADLCKQGTQTIEYNELKGDTEYIFYVFAVNPETAYTATEIVTEKVTTENVADSGVTITIEVKNIFKTTADIYFTASDPNATFRRTVLTKEQYLACGSTDTERFAAFEANGYINSYTATGSTDINYTKGEPGVTFVALAFGVEGETPNTRIFFK